MLEKSNPEENEPKKCFSSYTKTSLSKSSFWVGSSKSSLSSTATSSNQQTSKPSIPSQNLAWVDKYKLTSVKQIVGQQGSASDAYKLMNLLDKWCANRDPKKKLTKHSPWAKSVDGAYF